METTGIDIEIGIGSWNSPGVEFVSLVVGLTWTSLALSSESMRGVRI